MKTIRKAALVLMMTGVMFSFAACAADADRKGDGKETETVEDDSRVNSVTDGRDTENGLKEDVKDVTDDVRDDLDRAGEKVSEGMDRAGEKVSEGVDHAGERVSEGIDDAGDDIKDGIEDMKH